MFHSNFENQRTYTATVLKPGASRIELLPSPEIERWFPATGGKAIIEPNYPQNREVFQYAKREGRILFLAKETAKSHPKYAAVLAGGLAEWFSSQKELRVHTQDAITPDADSPLAGMYCARITGNAKGPAVLVRAFSSPLPRALHLRFLVRVSDSFSRETADECPLSFFRFGRIASPKLFLTKDNTELGFGLRTGPHETLIERKDEERIRVSSNHIHCVEISIERMDSIHSYTRLWINDLLQSSLTCKHRLFETSDFSVMIGKAGNPRFAGSFWLDQVTVSDSLIGPVPPAADIIFTKGKLVARGISQGRPRHALAAGQWQISAGNQWLLPAFNSGEDTINVSEWPHPSYSLLSKSPFFGVTYINPNPSPLDIPAGSMCFGRVRRKGKTGHWGPWSRACRFPMPPHPKVSTNKTPRILDAYFTRPNSLGRLEEIEKERWYDLHLRFRPTSVRSFMDVYLTGNPVNSLHNYLNRGGVFDPNDNYVMSFSFDDNHLWVRQDEGKTNVTSLIAKQGKFCDAAAGNSLLDPAAGRARARVRILEKAKPGMWKIRAFLSRDTVGVSPFYESLFNVREKKKAGYLRKKASGGIAFIAGILFCLALVVTVSRIRRAGTSETKAADASEDASQSETSAQDNRNVTAANEFIAANYTRPISLQDVGKAIGLTPEWLANVYKKATGQSILKSINEMRIDKAKELLRETKLPMSEIAFQTGFNSMANFNRTFKNITKVSPTQFRQNHPAP